MQYEQLLRYLQGKKAIRFYELEACLQQANGRLPSLQIKSVLGSVGLGVLLICSHKTRPLTTLSSQRQRKVITSKCRLFFFLLYLIKKTHCHVIKR